MITIRNALPEPARLRLKDIDGWSEQRIDRDDPAAARVLAESLAVSETGDPLSLGDWPVSAFDRLLLEIYRALYGNRAECRVACGACGAGFEFDLDPMELAAAQDAAMDGTPPPDAYGWWHVRAGFEVRAPRLCDLERGDPEILKQALMRGDASNPEEAETFLERAAPVLDLDIAATCPECDTEQTVRFSLADYLVTALAHERPFLLRETHLLAAHYGWSHHEILDLNRRDRRAYAALIESERSASRRIRQVAP